MELHWKEIVAQGLGFLIVFVVLRAFAWKKFLELLEQRRQRISDEFRNIDGTKRELEGIRAGYDAKIEEIEQTARARIQEAISEGKKISEDIREKAQQDARAMVEKAQETTAIELAKAKEELKHAVVDLTINATQKMIKEKITESGDRQLVRDFLEEIDSRK